MTDVVKAVHLAAAVAVLISLVVKISGPSERESHDEAIPDADFESVSETPT